MQAVQIDWRRASWEEGCEAVARFTDRLGKGVDEGIFETVVALNLLGLRTFQSCEGHLDHGVPYPWVTVVDQEVQRPYLRAWERVCALEERARATNREEDFDAYLSVQAALQSSLYAWKRADPLFARLVGLLDAFYEEQPAGAGPVRLLVMRHHPGMCRIRPAYAAASPLPESLRARYLARGRAEMAAWTAYLKRLWQQQSDSARATQQSQESLVVPR